MPTSDFGDDFFGEETPTKTVSTVVEAVVAEKDTKEIVETNQTTVVSAAPTEDIGEVNLEFKLTNEAPKLIGACLNSDFMSLVERIRAQYTRLPSLNYSEVLTELQELTVPACATPTLQIINQELQKSQAAKDRVTELDIQITQCLMFKERVVDILEEAWNKFCEEKSADKRKGDGMYRLANFEMDLAKTESLSKACKYVMMNLVSLQDTLYRRITNIQLQIKLMDIGRTALPDFDFSKKSMDIQLDAQDEHFAADKREDGSFEAKESDF